MCFNKRFLAGVFTLFFSLFAKAQYSESNTEVSFELRDQKQTTQIYRYLGLPIQWGNLVTGKPHQYKSFSDKQGATLIYVDQLNGAARVLVKIFKIQNSDTTEVSNDQDQIVASLFDSQDSELLFNSLLMKEMVHGGYAIRALSNDALNFSLSCMKDLTHGTGTSCQVFIFKDKTPQD